MADFLRLPLADFIALRLLVFADRAKLG